MLGCGLFKIASSQTKVFSQSAEITLLVKAIENAVQAAPWLKSSQKVQWQGVLNANIYPVGSALGWHNDRRIQVGAIAFYCHKVWEPDFGGELLIGQQLYKPEDYEKSDRLRKDWQFEQILREPVIDAIMPVPNRLVLLAPNILHCIRRVDINAGNHARMSLTAFLD